MELANKKHTIQQRNNGPVTRASSNRQAKLVPVKDNSNTEQDKTGSMDAAERNLAALHRDIEEILDSDVYCAICREVYVHPIILNCSHSFCKFCLIFWLNKQVCCPSCRMVAVFQTENLALRNTISKMISNTSAKYKRERSNLVQQRMEAEAKAQQEGLVPLMEKKEAELEADLAYRVRNGRRRHRVIGQWKGPNGATIWRTNFVGDRIIRHSPDDATDSSAESAGDIEITDDEDLRDSEADGHERRSGRQEEAVEAESDTMSDYRVSTFQLSVGDLPGHDSDSNDSEFFAPNATTSDEDDDMGSNPHGNLERLLAVGDTESDTASDCRVSIFEFYNNVSPREDSDSADDEFVAPDVTTSDEEEDDRMGDMDEETCEEFNSDDNSESSETTASDESDDSSTNVSDHSSDASETSVTDSSDSDLRDYPIRDIILGEDDDDSY